MASKLVLSEIEDNFFLCSVCLDLYNDPKLLPCLHRYCKNCLKGLIQEKESEFECPMCKQICDIPDEREDGFKTDFHFKNMVEFIQLQNSFDTDEIRKCVGCSKAQKVASYCFKCNGFLCDHCCQLHLNSRMLRDHRQNVVSLKDVAERSLTLEKLSSLTEAPWCSVHTNKMSEVCCATCGNLPICMICGQVGEHKGHDLYDVETLASIEREKLEEMISILNECEDNITNTPQKIKHVHERLETNIPAKNEALQSQYRKEVEKMFKKLTNNNIAHQQFVKEIKNKEKETLDEFKRERVTEIHKIDQRYEKHVDEEKTQNNATLINEQMKHNNNTEKLALKLKILKTELKKIDAFINTTPEQHKDALKEFTSRYENRGLRSENLRASSSSIIASKNYWTQAQCLPDIRTAYKALIEDIKQELPVIESLSDFVISDILVVDDKVTIADMKVSVVEIEGIKENGLNINGITVCGNGRIVITGRAMGQYSHVTVINIKGKILHQEEIRKKDESIYSTRRTCDFLPPCKVASCCPPNEIGIYDVRKGPYVEKSTLVSSNWPVLRIVTCVATDPVNKHIIAGTNREVYVFDDQLKFSRTITLPGAIGWVSDIAYHDNHLMVCDEFSRRAYVVTMVGPEAELVYEFPIPDVDAGDWGPICVCIDENGFIYMLWRAYISSEQRRILVQYSHDGRQGRLQLLSAIPADEDTSCVTALNTEEGTKLLVATESTGKMYVYCLVADV